MKIIKDSKHKLLIQKIKRVAEIIDSDSPSEENVYEAIIDFILVFEHVIKKILYAKNKLLIYNFDLDINKVNVILKNQKNTLFTIQLSEALPRYIKIFPKSKLSKQEESIEILITNRNKLEHDIDIKNMQSKEEIMGVLSGVFPIFLTEAEKILGTLPSTKIKKEKTYSEKDIQNIYDSIVLSKIKNYKRNSFGILPVTSDEVTNFNPRIGMLADKSIYGARVSSVLSQGINYGIGNERCPRCSNFSFSKKSQLNSMIFSSVLNRGASDLYICSNCNLELTDLEYDAVQRLKAEGKITGSGLLYGI
jgi:hypothetical protein